MSKEVEKEENIGLNKVFPQSVEIDSEKPDNDLPKLPVVNFSDSRTKKNSIYLLDKVSGSIFTLSEDRTDKENRIAVERAGSNKEIDIIYTISFGEDEGSELKIDKKLNAYDKRVYMAVVSLLVYRKSNIMTISQIYTTMGYDGIPGKADKNKIESSLIKMRGASIYIDNTEEAMNYNYKIFKYDGSLLPNEKMAAIVNGVEVEVVRLLKIPPLYIFAEGRKHLTTISRELLQGPLSKTEINLNIVDYLLVRTIMAKRGKQKKILFKSIFERAGIKENKSRKKRDILDELDWFVEKKHIYGYKLHKDGVTIITTKPKEEKRE